jgi:hypothetical protein
MPERVWILFLLCLFGFNAPAQTTADKPLLILSNLLFARAGFAQTIEQTRG